MFGALEHRVERRTCDLLQAKEAAEHALSSLAASEDRFRTLSACAPIGIFQTNDAGRITYANPPMLQDFGASESTINDLWIQLVHPLDRDRVFTAWNTFHAKTGDRLLFEFRLLVDDEERWLLLRATCVADTLNRIGTVEDITDRKRAEAEQEALHQQRLRLSRRVGMGEIATGVLHNVGNVLNSVNVASSLLHDKVRKPRSANLRRVCDLVNSHTADLAAFFTQNEKGKLIPLYLEQLCTAMEAEQQEMLKQCNHLTEHVEHANRIVAVQQSIATVAGVIEEVALDEMLDSALKVSGLSPCRHGIEILRHYETTAPLKTDAHKLLQILVNLFTNAKQSVLERRLDQMLITIDITTDANKLMTIAVGDNGIGIQKENLARIFAYGFTTKRDGHGFGLHGAALLARELGGALKVQSEGTGCGAVFVVELPCAPPARSAREEAEKPEAA